MEPHQWKVIQIIICTIQKKREAVNISGISYFVKITPKTNEQKSLNMKNNNNWA